MALSNILDAATEGGFAKPSLYEVTPGGRVSVSQFLIKSAQLPAATLNTIEIPYRGRKVKIPSNRTFEPWNITVTYAVGDTDIRADFQNWIDAIQSPKADNDNLAAWGEDWSVSLLDPVTKTPMTGSEFTLIGCYPSEIGTVSLDTETTDSLAEFSATIYYSYHTVA
tara:strand:- start:538 stop:1038 length:501 start_codon:yes stop_codon:yes gene_type:complete